MIEERNKDQEWEERIAMMRPYIRRQIAGYRGSQEAEPLRGRGRRRVGILDREQCALECELALWRGQSTYNVTQDFIKWAKAVVRHAVLRHAKRDEVQGNHEISFAELASPAWAEEEDETMEEVLSQWLVEHALDGTWGLHKEEEWLVLRISISEFEKMIIRRFGKECRMARAIAGIRNGETMRQLAIRLEEHDREVQRLLQVSMRAALERFWEGGRL